MAVSVIVKIMSWRHGFLCKEVQNKKKKQILGLEMCFMVGHVLAMGLVFLHVILQRGIDVFLQTIFSSIFFIANSFQIQRQYLPLWQRAGFFPEGYGKDNVILWRQILGRFPRSLQISQFCELRVSGPKPHSLPHACGTLRGKGTNVNMTLMLPAVSRIIKIFASDPRSYVF